MGAEHPKTNIVVPVIRMIVVAGGTAQIVIVIDPGAAAKGADSSMTLLLWTKEPFSLFTISCIWSLHPTAKQFTQLNQLKAAEFIRFQIDKLHLVT